MATFIHPEGWPPAKGFAHAVAAEGRVIYVAGQWGSSPGGDFPAGLPAQTRQALQNIADVLKAAGAKPEHVVRLTWYMTDLGDYNTNLRDIGEAYRAVMGRHFPAMTAVEIARLVDPRALVEIEATAVVPR
ncbi:MAG TPA: RidA family protein [Stellaceae bacterium]|nr:RidA family protein [Stellaceae bacterium]